MRSCIILQDQFLLLMSVLVLMKTKGRLADAAATFSSPKGQIWPAGSHLNAPHDDLPMTSVWGDFPDVQVSSSQLNYLGGSLMYYFLSDLSRTCGYPCGDTTSMGHLLNLSSQLPFAVPATSSDMLWESSKKNLSEPLPSHCLFFYINFFM